MTYTNPKYFNLTVDEYLQMELQSQIRHEYIAGQAYTLPGGSEALKIITGNLLTKLRTHLQGTKCRVFASEMKLKIENSNIFYYPELSVVCDYLDREPLFKSRPTLIVEVYSATTERVDRNEKLMNYRQFESLREYVLISESETKVDIYRKDGRDNWSLEIFVFLSDVIKLNSVNLTMTVAEIYEDVGL